MEPLQAVVFTLITGVGALALSLLVVVSKLYYITEAGLGENYKSLKLMFERLQYIAAKQDADLSFLEHNHQPMKH